MTLIFLHGSACTSVVWKEQIAQFDDAIALDFPGHPDGETLETINDMAAWLLGELNSRALSDVVLVGHSMGSAVALQSAIMGHPAIKGLVLIGAGARLRVMPVLLESLKGLAAANAPLPAQFLSSNQAIAEPLRSEVNAAITRNGASVMLNDFLACDQFDVMNELAELTLPVQVVVGAKDIMTPPKYAEYLEKGLTSAQLDVVKGAGHMVFAEKPEPVNAIISSFLARVGLR